MLKNITSFLLLLFFVQVTNAQFLWLEDETNTRKIELTAASF